MARKFSATCTAVVGKKPCGKVSMRGSHWCRSHTALARMRFEVSCGVCGNLVRWVKSGPDRTVPASQCRGCERFANPQGGTLDALESKARAAIAEYEAAMPSGGGIVFDIHGSQGGARFDLPQMVGLHMALPTRVILGLVAAARPFTVEGGGKA